jgi:hypothetical protein
LAAPALVVVSTNPERQSQSDSNQSQESELLRLQQQREEVGVTENISSSTGSDAIVCNTDPVELPVVHQLNNENGDALDCADDVDIVSIAPTTIATPASSSTVGLKEPSLQVHASITRNTEIKLFVAPPSLTSKPGMIFDAITDALRVGGFALPVDRKGNYSDSIQSDRITDVIIAIHYIYIYLYM